jgi:hypothetical protein
LAGLLRRELLLGALLVGVGPVEDLLLDELAGGQRPERRARQVEVGLGRDGQELGLVSASSLKSGSPRSLLLARPERVVPYSALISSLRSFFALEEILGRCPAMRRSGIRRRPPGPSSLVWSHSFFGLMFPAASRPSRSWKEPK